MNHKSIVSTPTVLLRTHLHTHTQTEEKREYLKCLTIQSYPDVPLTELAFSQQKAQAAGTAVIATACGMEHTVQMIDDCAYQ